MKKLTLTGNVGRDPQIRTSQEGTEFATFSLGTAMGKNKDGTTKTDWTDVSVNGKMVDVVRRFVRKGSKLLIEGYPTPKAYLSKDNKPMATLQVYAHNVELLGGNKQEDSGSDTYTLPEVDSTTETAGALTSDEIPFN